MALANAQRPTAHRGAATQRGYVMVLSIILLLVITLMTVSMAKSFYLEEGMAGNIREKNRAFAAAQAALSYAESAVTQGSSPVTCATSGPPLTAGQVCLNAMSLVSNLSAGTSPLSAYFTMPTSLTSTYLNVNTTVGSETFFSQPGAYIQFLGIAPGSVQFVYAITAYGYGSTPNSVAIVASTYKVQSKTGFVNANLGN